MSRTFATMALSSMAAGCQCPMSSADAVHEANGRRVRIGAEHRAGLGVGAVGAPHAFGILYPTWEDSSSRSRSKTAPPSTRSPPMAPRGSACLRGAGPPRPEPNLVLAPLSMTIPKGEWIVRHRPVFVSASLLALLVPAVLSAQPAREASRPTWPSRAQLGETADSLARPYTLAFVRVNGREALAIARRDGGAWMLESLLDESASPAGCDAQPCPWPASLGPASALVEPPPLPARVRDAVAYARTLYEFEGPLSVDGEASDDERFVERLPEQAWSIASPRSAPSLVPFLEDLRRFHPVGGCSMDRRPQLVARMRATAAAQAGRSGWAVQGWVDTVAYFRSSRMAWSSYGQSHPEGHLELLEMVGVDPARLMLGLSIDLPGQPAVLGLADARRVAPDLGPSFAADLRALAADPSLDPLNRARLLAMVADLPFENDPLWSSLPAESRALLTFWSR